MKTPARIGLALALLAGPAPRVEAGMQKSVFSFQYSEAGAPETRFVAELNGTRVKHPADAAQRSFAHQSRISRRWRASLWRAAFEPNTGLNTEHFFKKTGG